MSVVQDQFYKFHGNIKLDLEDNKELITKRDMLIKEIRAYLKKKAEDEGSDLITFSEFNQGSYAMGTGNKPIDDDQDYDIDGGLLFDISKEDYDPIEVKRWVFKALDAKQFRKVEWKKPCIRVQYFEEGYPRFHIDFAIYSAPGKNYGSKTYLAKGKPTLSKEQNIWEESEPKKLKELIDGKFQDTESRKQMKRTIRFFKRWRDNKFDSVNGRPTGIALTALAYQGFAPKTRDYLTNEEKIDDLRALIEFTDYIIGQFSWLDGRISVTLPVPPYNNLFAKMTDAQCKDFKERLKTLLENLNKAEKESDPHEACKILKKEFGRDFPVPPKESTGQYRRAAVVGTSESA
jgi:hypothetical protein